MTGCSRLPTRLGFHPRFEVVPALLCNVDLARRDPAGLLLEDVQKDDEILGPTEMDAIQLRAVMAAQFPQLALNLRAVREGEMWIRERKHVQAVDLVIDGDLPLRAQLLDEVVDRLSAIGGAVVNSLQVGHEAS